MQSLTASYNSPLNDLRVGGSKEDGPTNHSISPVDHCAPPLAKALTALRTREARSARPRRCRGTRHDLAETIADFARCGSVLMVNRSLTGIAYPLAGS